MCKAKEITNKLFGILDEIDGINTTFNDDLSTYDKMTSDILHKIELTNFNASEG